MRSTIAHPGTQATDKLINKHAQRAFERHPAFHTLWMALARRNLSNRSAAGISLAGVVGSLGLSVVALQRVAETGAQPALRDRVYGWIGPAGRMLLWEHHDLVYTVVGDATEVEMRAVVAAVDEQSESFLERITGSLIRPFGL